MTWKVRFSFLFRYSEQCINLWYSNLAWRRTQIKPLMFPLAMQSLKHHSNCLDYFWQQTGKEYIDFIKKKVYIIYHTYFGFLFRLKYYVGSPSTRPVPDTTEWDFEMKKDWMFKETQVFLGWVVDGAFVVEPSQHLNPDFGSAPNVGDCIPESLFGIPSSSTSIYKSALPVLIMIMTRWCLFLPASGKM